MTTPWRSSVSATRHAGLVVATVVVLYVLARLTGDSWLIFGAAAAAACVVVDFVAVAAGSGLRLTFTRPTRCVAGDEVAVAFRVSNGRRWMLNAAEVYDEHPGFERASALLLDLPSGRRGRIMLRTRATTRGVYRDSGAYGAVVTGPLGLFQRGIRGRVAGPVIVHPRRVVPMSLPTIASRYGARASGRRGWGLEPHGLRPWRPGDAAHAIHWRSTARVGEPVVLERESEVMTGLVVLVGPATPGQLWEDCVATAAATALAALQQGIAPVLVSADGVVEPAAHLTATDVLDWFAALSAGRSSSEALAATAANAAGPGGTVLWLSTVAAPAGVSEVVGRANAALVPVRGLGTYAA